MASSGVGGWWEAGVDVVGRTGAGRALVVAVFHVEGFTWKVIGAREMSGSELAEFGRWEATGDE